MSARSKNRRLKDSVRRSNVTVEQLEDRLLFAFGLTTVGGNYVVDNGGNLTFSLKTTNLDLTSVKYKGQELTAPFALTSRYSHYESGLSSSSAITTSVDNAAGVIIVAATDSGLGVTQYFIARRGFDNIYMATYAATLPTPGEMRYITYLNRSIFTNFDKEADTAGKTVIEGADVFADTTTGITASKFYSARPFIDDHTHGITGAGVGAFMTISSTGYETSSGGPFFQDIDEQNTSASDELYWYMNSGHNQTEAYRPGLHGPYALQFTDGSAPAPTDFTFVSTLGLTGYVTDRGHLTGLATGVPSNEPAVVGISNAAAEYWSHVAPDGTYDIPDVIPGDYTVTLYKNELAVATTTTTITAHVTNTVNIASAEVVPTALWRIGTFDGTPMGFKNYTKIMTEHPSDVRMRPWDVTTYNIGVSPLADFPEFQFKGVNNPTTIQFKLTAAQVQEYTLRIGITEAQFGGRPSVVTNLGKADQHNSPNPGPSTQPNSRSFTKATFRGNNTMFTYDIPASSLHVGLNTLTLTTISGSGSGTWLSAAVAYDAVDLIPVGIATVAAALVPASKQSAIAPISTATSNDTITALLTQNGRLLGDTKPPLQ